MLDYSYPLYFRNWKTGRSGRGGGEGAGSPVLCLVVRVLNEWKYPRRQRDFLQLFLLNFDLFVRLFKQSYSQSREDTISFIHTI